MRILGVDPGSRKTGWGCIELNPKNNSVSVVDHGVIYLDVDKPMSDRLSELMVKLSHVVEALKPQQAVLEEVFVQKNIRSALLLGQARGVVLAVFGQAGLSVLGVAPTRVKKSVVGAGRASKDQVGMMVKTILKLKELPLEDAADALALALSYGDGKVPVKRVSSGRAALAELAKRQGISL